MTFFIFCSFEVGGVPFKMADILNQNGIKTLYASVAPPATSAHDTTQFHRSGPTPDWDVSSRFAPSLHSPNAIVKELNLLVQDYGLNFALATGINAHLLNDAGLPYIYWCFGSDLDQDSFGPVCPPNYPLWKRCLIYPWHRLRVRPRMRRSLRLAEAVCIAPYQLPALNRVVPGKALFHFPHFISILPYEELMGQKTVDREEIARQIGPGRFVFSATRHVWQGYLRCHSDYKGNDIMLQAFQAYLKHSGDSETRLVLVRKGPDVEASQQLIGTLGLTRRVVWLEEMKRQDLYAYYRGAEACFGQFGTPVFTYSALEPLASATPCFSYFQSPGEVPYYASLPPAINTRDPETIAQLLTNMLGDSERQAHIARESWLWASENCSERNFANVVESLIVSHVRP